MNTRKLICNLIGITFSAFTLVNNAAALSDESLTQALSEALSVPAKFDVLNTKVQTEGPVRIIVRLKASASEKTIVGFVGPQAHRAAIAATQTQVMGKLARPTQVKTYKTVPYLALSVDAEDLTALRASPQIEAVFEDRLLPPALAESVPLVGGDAAWAAGYSGAGQTVAILDTGVDKTHPELVGKVVAEACFSTTDPVQGTSSVCPNGLSEDIGEGAAAPCSANSCEHGTHVAGIAAGRQGVAKDADIIAVQVFSQVNASEVCAQMGYPAPCTSASISDIIAGLEYVYELSNQFSIAAVNMSLGGGYFSAACDDDPTKPIIDNLRAVSIATVIASGNESYTDGLGSPACISSAISVGATDKSDQVAYFSNSSNDLDLLAPGVDIVSSVPGGYEPKNGTSMAAPHVAGAFAVLKGKAPQAGVDTLLNALTSTGVLVADARNGIIKPRIQVDQALVMLDGDIEQPEPLTPLAPVDVIHVLRPTFIWSAEPQASWYFIFVQGENGATMQGYTSAQEVGCDNGEGRCAVLPNQDLEAGQDYSWWVAAIDAQGSFLRVSDTAAFRVE